MKPEEAAIDYEQLNVSIINGKLHYIASGKVMAANMFTISAVLIGDDMYMNVQGELAKVLKEAEGGAVVEFTRVDTEELAKVDVGYGKSSLTYTENLSVATAFGYDPENKNIEQVMTSKSGGKVLPVKVVKRLFFDGQLVKATKYDVFRIENVDKAGLKKFLKENKTKFSDVDDLAKLVGWLHVNVGQKH